VQYSQPLIKQQMHAMAVPCEPPAATLILNQLKHEVAELKASYKLASQPSNSSAPSLQSLEREAQLARKQYDGLLEQRRKQAAELEQIIATWQQLQAGVAGEAACFFKCRHLEMQAVSLTPHQNLAQQRQAGKCTGAAVIPFSAGHTRPSQQGHTVMLVRMPRDAPKASSRVKLNCRRHCLCTACLAAQLQDTPVQRRAHHLQAQLTTASSQLAEALDTQQQYTDVIQQLKQGHSEFERTLEQLRQQLAGQQQLVCKVRCYSLTSNYFAQEACSQLCECCGCSW
jgi:hypothetical protein